MTWFDNVPPDRGWSSLWNDLSLCSCGGIRRIGKCQVCGAERLPDATSHGRVTYTVPGAEGRYEDYLYLRNDFVHGNLSAVSDALALAEKVVLNLQAKHLAWTPVFNRRAALARSASE